MPTHLLIGTNRGIGLELTRQLVTRGDTVLAACRTASDPLRQLDVEIIENVDITGQAGLEHLAASVSDRTIDNLWVVAGVLRRVHLEDLDLDEIRSQFEINALGPLRAVAALVDRLPNGSKIGLLTSRMGSIDDNTSGAHYAYRMSKAALNMAGRSLSVDLAPRGVSVAILHPGYVRTDMTQGRGLIDADESARGLIARMDELTPETTGRFWHQQGYELPW